jgi:hypothetical protein
MEPDLNPALEQQAIGRVHRLGQERKVEVVPLLVKDSVETRISQVFLEEICQTLVCRRPRGRCCHRRAKEQNIGRRV